MRAEGERVAEEPRISVMGALDLALDVAYHDGSARDLAVAAEAWQLAGYDLGALDIAHGGRQDQILRQVESAYRGRPRRLLRADARGMLAAFYALAENGVITYGSCSESARLRWLARGGHERLAASQPPLARDPEWPDLPQEC